MRISFHHSEICTLRSRYKNGVHTIITREVTVVYLANLNTPELHIRVLR